MKTHSVTITSFWLFRKRGSSSASRNKENSQLSNILKPIWYWDALYLTLKPTWPAWLYIWPITLFAWPNSLLDVTLTVLVWLTECWLEAECDWLLSISYLCTRVDLLTTASGKWMNLTDCVRVAEQDWLTELYWAWARVTGIDWLTEYDGDGHLWLTGSVRVAAWSW